MGKFTLLLAAFAVSMSSLAQVKMQKSVLKKEIEAEICAKYKNLEQFQVTSIKNSVLSPNVVMQNKLQTNAVKRVIAKEENQVVPEEAYLETSLLGEYYGFLMYAYMQPAYVAYDNDDVYILPHGDLAQYLGFIKGTVTHETHMYSGTEGIDSLTFENAQAVGGLTDGTVLRFYSCGVSGSQDEGFKATPDVVSTSFGGYYIRETGEIIVSGVFGIFAENTTDSYAPTFINLIIDPVSQCTPYMFKGTVSAVDYFDSSTESKDVPVYYGYDGFYVKSGNLSGGIGSEWLQIYEDESGNYGIYADQYVGTFSFTNKDGSTLAADCVTMPIGSDMYSKDVLELNVKTDADYTVTLTSKSGEMLGHYLYGEGHLTNSNNRGYYSAYSNYKVVISPESYTDANGINGVSTETAKVASKEYFDLSGRKVENTSKGLVIEKITYADGKTLSRKVVK